MKIVNILLLSLVFALSITAETSVNWETFSKELEINQTIPLSLRTISDSDNFPVIKWDVDNGTIKETFITGEVDFIAPASACTSTITANVKIGNETIIKEIKVEVLPEGALKKTADILIEFDTNTLKNVWVDETHPSENFTPPLSIKGTFRLDPETGKAFAGGSWPSYTMYDDGTHGDKTADDGIWTILMEFEKSDAAVYIAFDDASEYRVEFESGVAWRVKMAFIELDDYPDDHSNVKFVPDTDKTIKWDAKLAEAGGIYEEN